MYALPGAVAAFAASADNGRQLVCAVGAMRLVSVERSSLLHGRKVVPLVAGYIMCCEGRAESCKHGQQCGVQGCEQQAYCVRLRNQYLKHSTCLHAWTADGCVINTVTRAVVKGVLACCGCEESQWPASLACGAWKRSS
jgi:hypothetical protein